MNRTPKVRQKKSNIWGVIFMKLSYEVMKTKSKSMSYGKMVKALSLCRTSSVLQNPVSNI